MNIYPQNLKQQLDFSVITERISSICISKNAKAKVTALKASIKFDEIQSWLLQTNEALLSIHTGDGVPHSIFPEIDQELKLLSIQNAVLTASQLNHIRSLMHRSNELLNFLKEKQEAYPKMTEMISHVEKDSYIISSIDQIIDKDSIVKDDASPTLFSIRKALAENRKTGDRIYRAHIQKLKKLGFLADFEESYINGRRVLGVLAEHKREIKGMILDNSATGKISFIEPSNVIEINNEKILLEDDERKEIYKILKTLTAMLKPLRSEIKNAYELLIEFDFLVAKAKLAFQMKATCPKIIPDGNTIHLINAFHPVLFLQNSEKKIPTVPINCHLKEDERIMVISGPNAGGKSITLKTIGLIQIMLQCGLLIPASAKSELSIKEQLFGDIGDNQSIEDGLSTYSSRLIKMKYFLENINAKTLFLIDEFGTGSDPDMGGALAEIILDKLNESNSNGIVTTHFTNLKLLANHKNGIINACMLFNSKSLKPLYQLHIGEPGSSFTFEVAEKIGLDKKIIDDAKKKLSKERVRMDSLLHQLQEEKNVQLKLKRDLVKQMSKTTAAKREFQELNEKLENKIALSDVNKEEKQKLIDFGRKLHQLTQEWQQNKNKKEVINKFVKLAGFELHKKKAQDEYEKTQEFKQKRIDDIISKIEVGSHVRMLKSKEIGTIQSIKSDRAEVLFGRIRINVGLEKLEVARTEATKK